MTKLNKDSILSLPYVEEEVYKKKEKEIKVTSVLGVVSDHYTGA